MLYRRYVAGQSKYPAAPPGRSYHNYGRAFDVDDASPAQLAAMGQLWESWGGRWGGRFGDPIHFEA
jgi:LAS superfamily LD-carboxypeptidase LdcB